MTFFCTPLIAAQQKYEISPHLQEKYPGESFMVFIQISLITAAVISAALDAVPDLAVRRRRAVPARAEVRDEVHPAEHRAAGRAGCVFVYYVVLPWTLEFFIAFTLDDRPARTSRRRTSPPPADADRAAPGELRADARRGPAEPGRRADLVQHEPGPAQDACVRRSRA